MVTQITPNPETWAVDTTEQFARLLSFAGYPELAMARYLAFYAQRIAPCFERQATVLRMTIAAMTDLSDTYINPRSTLTTDGSPIEYSLSFAGSANSPTVRLSFVPDAMSNDPFSVLQAERLVKVLAAYPKVDTTRFHEVRVYFDLAPRTDDESAQLLQRVGHGSQIMLGFDFDRIPSTSARNERARLSNMRPKAYFIRCMAENPVSYTHLTLPTKRIV